MNIAILLIVILLCSATLMAVEKTDSVAKEQDTINKAHQFFAVNCNNLTWDLLDKSTFSAEEKDAVLQAAFASAYHWSQVGTGINFQRGEWLIARVYTVLGNKQEALAHALRCLDLTTQYRQEMQDFDLAYAYEGAARAYAPNKNNADYKIYYAKAQAAGEEIADPADKDQFAADFAGGNWFGMK